MQKIITTILLSMMFSIGLQAKNQIYTVNGAVSDSITEHPLSGVYITNGKIACQSSQSGKFQLKGLSSGEQTLYFMYYSSYSRDSIVLNIQKDTTIHVKIQEDYQLLNDVVVTGTRTPKRLSEVPIMTHLVHAQDIKKAGSISTMESLQDNIPGLVLSPNIMGNNLTMKGLTSRYILFLIDGERIVSEGARGNINFDQIDVGNIQRIEIVDGASSALYGSNAVGAVINIITKEPIYPLQAGAYVTYQNYNTSNQRIHVGVSKKKIQSRINIFHNQSDGYDIKDGAYAAKYNNLGSNIKFKYQFNPSFYYGMTANYFRNDIKDYKVNVDESHPLSEKYSLNNILNYRYKKHDLRLSLHGDMYYDQLIIDAEDNLKKERSHSSYISGKLLDTYILSNKLELVSGFEYNNQGYFSKTLIGSQPRTISVSDYNLFSQGTYKLLKGLDVVGGLRYTYNSAFKSAFSPKIALMYKWEHWNFRGGVGSAFRAPSIKELHYDFSRDGMFRVLGNPDLKSENGLYYSLSSEYTKGAFNTSLSLYYNRIDNKITQYYVVKENELDEFRYKNVSDAILKGYNVNIMYTFFKQLVVKANYSYCDAIDHSTGLQLTSNVKHSATLSTTWNAQVYQSPFSLQLSGRMHSPKLYHTSYTTSSGQEIISRDDSKPYSIWKATFIKPIKIKQHTLELSLKCYNIFDFKEESFVDPGRQFMIGLRYNFN